MSAPVAVYRSDHPNVLAVWMDFIRENAAFKVNVRSFLNDYAPGFDAMAANYPRGRSVVGISAKYDDPIPDGWRRPARFDGQFKPDKRTRLGKEIAEWMGRLRLDDPRQELPGMPDTVVVGDHFYHPSLREMDGFLYVGWPLQIESAFAEDWSARGPLDHDIWERVPLSEYHALLEHEEVAS